MCATVSSVSIRSAPAKKSIFFVVNARKLCVSPANHSVQYSLVAIKSVLQTYFYSPVASSVTCFTWAGMETRALRLSLTWPPITPYLITDCKSGKLSGRFLTIYSMKGRASIAVPSTTSIIATPRMHFCSSDPYISCSIFVAVLIAIAPPIECPTKMMERSANFSWT